MLDLFIWIIGQHTKKRSEDEVRGPSSHLTWNDPNATLCTSNFIVIKICHSTKGLK